MPRRIVDVTVPIATSEVAVPVPDGAVPRHVALTSDGSQVKIWFETDAAMQRERDRAIHVQSGSGDAPDKAGLQYVGTAVNEAVGAFHIWITR